MAEQTDGPWTVTEARGPDDELCFHEIRDTDGRHVASTWGGPHLRRALLIAAAPALLAALRDLIKHSNHGDADRDCEECRLIVAARAAYVKATEPRQ